jgi:adenine-specific DNA-methyltransferase
MPCTNKGGNVYKVILPNGRIIEDEWRFKKETFDKLISENKIVIPRGGEGKPRYKLFLEEKRENGVLANTWLDNLPSNQEGTREIKTLFSELVFDTPKPVGLIKFLIDLSTSNDSIILDFFSGSSSTAHSVISKNCEDGGKRKFIQVQLPEPTEENSESLKLGYKQFLKLGKREFVEQVKR